MYAHFKGKLVHVTPTAVVVECSGVGYELHISLYTYERIKELPEVSLYAHLAVKEDAHALYGFYEQVERELFRYLISVNGIGAAIARMILSSFSPDELRQAISSGNVSLLKSVKGVGPKSAQRIILELQEKVQKADYPAGNSVNAAGREKEEALSALQMLGFSRNIIEKTVQKIMDEHKDRVLLVEEIIKIALKRL
jgi:Holliday junction DNA helicase RuvA